MNTSSYISFSVFCASLAATFKTSSLIWSADDALPRGLFDLSVEFSSCYLTSAMAYLSLVRSMLKLVACDDS